MAVQFNKNGVVKASPSFTTVVINNGTYSTINEEHGFVEGESDLTVFENEIIAYEFIEI